MSINYQDQDHYAVLAECITTAGISCLKEKREDLKTNPKIQTKKPSTHTEQSKEEGVYDI